MAGMMMKVLCIVVVCMMVAAPYAEALSCSDVVSKLSPCVNYLTKGGSVPAACCKGVKGLNAAARSTADKKTACGCMKDAYHSMSGIKSGNAAGLPRKCGVHIPYKISLSTDCNKLAWVKRGVDKEFTHGSPNSHAIFSFLPKHVLCMLVACMVVVAPYAEALSCNDVLSKLSPCINYLENGGSVPAACCKGVKGLNAAAKSTADKKTACGCMKNAYQSLSDIKSDNAEGLPRKCGVNIPYKISMNTDCNNDKDKMSPRLNGMMMKVLAIIVACMVVAAPYATALTCGEVTIKLSPCLRYLKNGGKVPDACCKGVKGLNAAAKTTADKKTACGCMKKAYKTFSGIKENNAVGLPKKCGVNIPYKISPVTDCNKI
ncbi:hypothetical protein M8C21_029967 [Ambrosia artemisiifolia]|uniref:Non-specific lipid-transfer protein n=1 Tax=Ambrosia artemisiifolia TaxID=4212 RepID=A0AAD5CVJ1_AMBAR|nr:hypothetical protein M8C21_029967 [Ambrosia artemisiifolia]